MNNKRQYRNNGAVGALLDEYERALEDLKKAIAGITDQELALEVDKETTDLDCVSIQTILAHVVGSGRRYVIAIRQWLGEEVAYIPNELLNSTALYQDALDEMFQDNVRLFDDYPEIRLEEYNDHQKIHVKWGQRYDVEQLIEHAIVHILRHRRQIERFLLKIRGEG